MTFCKWLYRNVRSRRIDNKIKIHVNLNLSPFFTIFCTSLLIMGRTVQWITTNWVISFFLLIYFFTYKMFYDQFLHRLVFILFHSKLFLQWCIPFLEISISIYIQLVTKYKLQKYLKRSRRINYPKLYNITYNNEVFNNLMDSQIMKDICLPREKMHTHTCLKKIFCTHQA